ncbi:aminotransferase class I/II-fold pyridoxal phosphate-dependent enzyme [Phytoactinopolyspora halotolerans]|uniref:Aminotransferase class I/II-fold pyridoxal phosphate-dependent enzyme n=1 Tax=Phytoactinopolyspora halotolerans TaxID=1981512 RepID=A0A6L9SFQ4_9ACTN|nr:aminotransferase class I/II-fold pyridoxal phosphate-dependent enzyme [Phytoactinopolyspora halotolerans]NEE03933.1 aminotransferase class I/II-fold pyridoxal phosphate-dependent enzyme [Phytoactinopolyspora halotolerans]
MGRVRRLNEDLPITGRTSREIAESIETGVELGVLRPRQALPSVRGLASRLGVSPSTVATAYRDLRLRGMVTSEAGRDTRIGTHPPVSTAAAQAARSGASWYEGPLPPDGAISGYAEYAAADDARGRAHHGPSGGGPAGQPGDGGADAAGELSGLRDVSDGNPDPRLLPDVQAALNSVEVRHYLYGEATILPALVEIVRSAFADVFAQLGADDVGSPGVAESDGDGASPGAAESNGDGHRPAAASAAASGGAVGDICLVASALDGIERLMSAWTRIGDRVVVEDPGHAGILDLVQAMGLEPIGVRMDDAGPLPADFNEALRQRPAAVVVTPRAQNPTGAAIDQRRAARLRRVLADYPEVAVVEDDHAWRLSSVPYASVCAGRRTWAVVRSVSKHLGPDLRLGFVTGDRRTVNRVAGRQMLGAGWVSHILQHAVVQLWRDERVRADVERAAATYQERQDAFLACLAEQGIVAHGRTGFNVQIPVPQEAPVIQEMQARGWRLRAGELHRIRSESFVRVTTATLEPAEGRRLATDLAAVLQPQRVSHLA